MVGIIGDVHGCYHTLVKLVETARLKYPDVQLYCAGDLVDRGNYSYKVIEYIMNNGIKTVLGNHDCMFLYAYYFPEHPYYSLWQINGNQKTLSGYTDNKELLQKHIAFIREFPLFFITEGCFISHAGVADVYSDRLVYSSFWSLAEWRGFLTEKMELDSGVLWNRSSLYKLDVLQVVGHTRHIEITPNVKTNSVYIDTAACSGNKLSCIFVENGNIVDSIAARTVPEDIF